MKIFLTGGAGRVGRGVVARLVESGHSLRVFDRTPEADLPGAEYHAGDILDYARVRELVRGCDAIVHLAAIPSPGLAPSETMFAINATGTFNVFQAAAEEGIRRVVQASSINAVGYYYGLREAPLHYLPLDEEHPSFSTDPYSFTKQVVEDTGAYFWRREGISSVALRFPSVVVPDFRHFMIQRRESVREIVGRLQNMSPEERQAWFEQQRSAYNDLRARRAFEDPVLRTQMWQPDSPLPADMRVSMGGRYNFFAMLDYRDAAQSVEKGLTAEYEGSHPLFVNDNHNYTGLPSTLLVELFYPDLPRLKRPLIGDESLVSNEKARELIGFEPEYHF